MKKILFALLCVFCYTACVPKSGEDTINDLSGKLQGEWVYDNPNEGVWETLKFTSSGIFYFSNEVGAWKISNTKNDGRYYIDGNNVTGTYFLDGVSMNLNMTITKITDYSFTASFNDTGLTFTYARKIDSKQLKPGEKYSPNYSLLVKDHIIGYASHKDNIASVNASTGEIKAESSGHTYIDVVSDEGTAVVEITCFDPNNFIDNYSWALTKSVPEIVDAMGTNYCYKNNKEGVIYTSDAYVVDSIKFYTGLIDDTHIEFVELDLNDNITKQEVLAFLNKKFEKFYEQESIYAYLYGEVINGLPVTLLYNADESSIVFSLLKPSSKLTEFNHLFGFDDATVKKSMNGYGYNYLFTDNSYSQDGSDYYSITDNQYSTMVGFVFNSKKVVCEYWIYLADNINYKTIYDDLLTRYEKNNIESTSSQYVFYDKSKRIKVEFDASGYVRYIDTKQEPYTEPAKVSWPDLAKGLGMTHEQILAEYGSSPYENTAEDIIYFINNDYISLFEFMFNSNTNLVYVATALVKESATVSSIVEYLNSLYTVFPNGTKSDGTQYAWINAADLSSATIGIIYYVNDRIVQYLDLTSNRAKANLVSGKSPTMKLHHSKQFTESPKVIKKSSLLW